MIFKNSPPKLSGISIKILSLYVTWHTYLSKHVPKTLRYSLGAKIDTIFCDILENISLAQFSENTQRLTFLSRTISKNDTLKFMLFTLLETDGIEQKKYIEFSASVEEIGKMLYGWKRQVEEKIIITKVK